MGAVLVLCCCWVRAGSLWTRTSRDLYEYTHIERTNETFNYFHVLSMYIIFLFIFREYGLCLTFLIFSFIIIVLIFAFELRQTKIHKKAKENNVKRVKYFWTENEKKMSKQMRNYVFGKI